MEKAFTKENFKLIITSKNLVIKVWVVFKYSVTLEFSGAAKQLISCVRSKKKQKTKKPSKNTTQVAGLWIVASVFANSEFKKSVLTYIK